MYFGILVSCFIFELRSKIKRDLAFGNIFSSKTKIDFGIWVFSFGPTDQNLKRRKRGRGINLERSSGFILGGRHLNGQLVFSVLVARHQNRAAFPFLSFDFFRRKKLKRVPQQKERSFFCPASVSLRRSGNAGEAGRRRESSDGSARSGEPKSVRTFGTNEKVKSVRTKDEERF